MDIYHKMTIMSKKFIKNVLRENLMTKLTETQPKETESAPDKKESDNKYSEKDYQEIQRKLDGTLLKASRIMAAAGLGNPKDATDRSLFSKKLRKATNDEGGVYQFNDEELAKIRKVLDNPSAFLSVKK